MRPQFTYGISPSSGLTATRSAKTFGFGENSGNLAFAFAIRQLVRGKHFSNQADAADLDQLAGTAVFPAANMLGMHADQAGRAARLAQLKNTKFVALGLGAQSDIENTIPELPEGTMKWLKEIERLAPTDAPNIGVRGDFSKKVLDHYGFGHLAEVLGCPSLFINPDPNLGKIIERNVRKLRRIAVVAGKYKPDFYDLERSLMDIVAQTNGAYVVQHPLDRLYLARGELNSIRPPQIEKARQELRPNLTTDQFLNWMHRYAISFYDVPAWMEYYRKFDLVVGMRIHGIAIALQAGVPAVCIVVDSRTLELCQVMNIPFMDARDYASGITLEQLEGLVSFDSASFEENRALLARKFQNFFKSNQLLTPSYLDRLASQA